MVKRKVGKKWQVKGVRGTWLKKKYSTKSAAVAKEKTVARRKSRVRHTRRRS